MDYEFTLKYQLASDDAAVEEVVERLGAAGCDDALIGICPASTILAKNDNYLGRCDGDGFRYFLGLTLALPAVGRSAAAALRR